MEDSDIPPDERWVLQLDFSNAFNSINREFMFLQFRDRLPSFSAWIEFCYSSQPLLHLGDRMIFSCSGVQQGDPLCPLGFALTLHPLVEEIKASHSSLQLNCWYLDDGTLCGSPGDLQAILTIIEREGPFKGLFLNREKSLLFIPQFGNASLNTLPQGITVSRAGFELLGCLSTWTSGVP